MTSARRPVALIVAMAGIFVIGLLLAWLFVPAAATGPCTVVSSAALPGIRETSGLAVSRRTPGLLWTHNDSGNDAVLFALDTAGVVRGRVRVPIRTRDWEDVSAARCPSGTCLYIADIGDNRLIRRQIQIYRVAEPAVTDAETAAPEVFSATYADGPHNAEAMFVIGTDIFIVTRDRVGGLYRSTLSNSRDLMFQRIGQLGLGSVTDAETSPDNKSVVVRTSYEAVFYRAADVVTGRFVPYLSIPIGALKEPQGEGVALDGDRLYLSSEGRFSRAGWFVSLRCAGM